MRLKTLGGLSVQADGKVVAGAAAQPRRLAILALLASAGDAGLTRDKLLGLLWPEMEPERARRALTQAIYALRKDLGSDEALTGLKEIRLNSEVVTSDLADFDAALRSGRLEAAVAAYGGPFLDGFHLAGADEFERWVESERSMLAHRYAESLHRLAAAATGRGDRMGSVGWWRKLAAQDPFNAQTAIGLMEALVAAGDRSGAIQHARVYEVLLEQELDLPPDQEVVRFAERLRSQPQPSEPRGRPAVGTADPAPAHAESPVGSDSPAMRADAGAESSDPVGAPPLPPRPAPLIESQPAEPAPSEARRPRRGPLLAAGVIAALAVLTALVVLLAPPIAPPLPQAGRTSRLTFEPELEIDPSISPDGRMVAYAAGPPGRMRIYVRQIGGGRVIPVVADLGGHLRLPVWSPDGSQLAFCTDLAIYLVPAFGGVTKLFASGTSGFAAAGSPAWSPDGLRLAYVIRDSVFVKPLAGGPARKLGTFQNPHSLAWSPDGDHLAVVEGNAGFIYGTQSPSGASSIGNIAPSAIWIVPLSGGGGVRVTDANYLNVSPVWTPDGRYLLFVSNRGGSRDIYAVHLDHRNRSIGDPERLTTGLNAHTISLSPEGSRLAYSVFTYSANIWALPIPAAGTVSISQAVPITVGNQVVEGMGVSNDGAWLAYDSDRGGNQDIWRLRLGGGADPIQVTATPSDEFMPSWSPNGREIAFYTFRSGIRRLFTVPAQGGDPRPVTREPGDERYPDWSPDGRRLVFHAQRGRAYQLYVVDRRSDSTWSSPRQLNGEGGEAGRWSPDGRSIVYLVFKEGHSLRIVPPEGGPGRELVRGDGSAERPLPGLAEWMPDSRSVVYKAFDTTGMASFWSVPAEGGPPRLLARFDDPSRPTNRPEFTTEGKQLYFTIGKPESDIWVMEFKATR